VGSDATALRFPEAAFDRVIAAYLLHVLAPAERAAALAELRRVVRPGGRLVVVTAWSARPAAHAVFEALARALPATLRGLRPGDHRRACSHQRFRRGSVRLRALRRAERLAAQRRRRCLERFARTPGRVTTLAARPTAGGKIILTFCAAKL